MGNQVKLKLSELRILSGKLDSVLFDHPELEGMRSLNDECKRIIERDPDYKRGSALLADAEENGGIMDGYARPQDYFFAIKEGIARPAIFRLQPGGKRDGVPYVELILCFKWNWYMDGEAFIYGMERDGQSRNFHEFLTEELCEEFQEHGEYKDAAKLRAALLKAGLEEKPELLEFVDKSIAARERVDAEDAERRKSVRYHQGGKVYDGNGKLAKKEEEA
jgi:hypothetical protein